MADGTRRRKMAVNGLLYELGIGLVNYMRAISVKINAQILIGIVF